MTTTFRHRLRVVYYLLRYWNKHPDWRLGQLVVNTALVADPFYSTDEFAVMRWKRGLRAGTFYPKNNERP